MKNINNDLSIVLETLNGVLISKESNSALSIFSLHGVIFKYFALGDSQKIYGDWTNDICDEATELNNSIWLFDGYNSSLRLERMNDIKDFARKWINHLAGIIDRA